MIFDIEMSNLTSSIIILVLLVLINIGLGAFLANTGGKTQLLSSETILKMIFFNVLLGPIFLLVYFLVVRSAFIIQIQFAFLGSFVLTIASTIVLKFLFFKKIEYGKTQEITVLKKNQKLLEVKNLKVFYPIFKGFLRKQVGSVKAVNGVSFEIKTGQTLGLVGESGCGKSTAANALLGLVKVEAGKLIFKDKEFQSKFTRDLRQKIQIVFQDPDASLNPRMTVLDIISEPLRNIVGVFDKKKLRKRVLKLLKLVSLNKEHIDRYPHEFSGGQKQRIIIARALACNPELIILDEPTSALDVSVQAQILNLLKGLQMRYGYGYLFITHNLSVVHHVASKIAVMYLGRIVEVGTNTQIFANPVHPYTKALLESRSNLDPNNQEIKFVLEGEVPSPINPPKGCPFHPRCSSSKKSEQCRSAFPEKKEVEDGHFAWCL